MLPAKIRVKLLSEAAGYVSVSHVLQREFSISELVELLLSVIGRDVERLRQILRAGSIVTGEYRYRWEPLDPAPQEIQSILGALPGPDPSRAFQPANVFLVRFRRGSELIEISREAGSHKPLFSRQSFWEGLLAALGNTAHYANYSYSDRADIFASQMSEADRNALATLLPLLRPKGSAERIAKLQPDRIEWLVRR
jgi:hypothetical protein